MSGIIEITTDLEKHGSEELMEDLTEEIRALDIGKIERSTSQRKEGTLTGLDLITTLLIIQLILATPEAIKALIDVVKEIRLRFADRKRVDLTNVPSITIVFIFVNGETIRLIIPSSLDAERKFIQDIIESRGKQ